jgi:hypothetical protein
MSVARWLFTLLSRVRPLAARVRSGSSWLILCVSLLGCTRAGASALLPSLQLGVVARRLAHAESGATRGASERWDAVALVSVQFRSRTVAAELPVRAELSPETWIAPCDADDFICLQEAADAEQELQDAFGDLQ